MKIGYGLSIIVLSLLMIVSCDSGPKVLTANTDSAVTDDPGAPQAGTSDEARMHEVEVQDVLQAEKYTYLDVQEGEERFWIAVSKMSAAKGDKFYYSGGLLKRNFYSREFDRNFETLFLVSRITPAPGNVGAQIKSSPAQEVERVKVELPEGVVSLEELFTNAREYAGKQIRVHGQCVKINNQIMDRNWIHIEDGSKDGESTIDLTVTTQERIPLGAVVTFEGTVSLNRDFGAGYRYDIIVEDATVVN